MHIVITFVVITVIEEKKSSTMSQFHLALSIGVGALLQQNLYGREVSATRSIVKRCPAVLRCRRKRRIEAAAAA